MDRNLSEFMKATQEVSKHMSLLYEMEQEKRQALLAYDIKKVDRLITKQQSFTMQLETSEKKRVEAQVKAGFANMNSKDILAKLSGNDKAEIEPIFTKMSSIAADLQEINRVSMEIAASELRILGNGTAVNSGNATYNPYKKSAGNSSNISFDGNF